MGDFAVADKLGGNAAAAGLDGADDADDATELGADDIAGGVESPSSPDETSCPIAAAGWRFCQPAVRLRLSSAH